MTIPTPKAKVKVIANGMVTLVCPECRRSFVEDADSEGRVTTAFYEGHWKNQHYSTAWLRKHHA